MQQQLLQQQLKQQEQQLPPQRNSCTNIENKTHTTREIQQQQITNIFLTKKYKNNKTQK